MIPYNRYKPPLYFISLFSFLQGCIVNIYFKKINKYLEAINFILLNFKFFS